jgi:hypothetical protein
MIFFLKIKMTATTPLRPIPELVPSAPRKCHMKIKEFLLLQRRDRLFQQCVLKGLFGEREESISYMETAVVATQTALFERSAHLHSTVNSLPVSTDTSCSICLEPFSTNHPLVQTQCGHIFHGECQEKWKSMARTCAYCRQKVHLVEELRGSGVTGQRLEIQIERVNLQGGNVRKRRTIQIKYT